MCMKIPTRWKVIKPPNGALKTDKVKFKDIHDDACSNLDVFIDVKTMLYMFFSETSAQVSKIVKPHLWICAMPKK